jgi:metacaspase-1
MAKKALLIGINRYKIPGADLRGCVNDVENMKGILTQMYGFTSKDVAVMTDFATTTKAMKAAMGQLVKDARSGDVLLLHYSGHGANVIDASGDEPDRRDEILCPTDLDWYKPLLDDWLRKTFNRLRSGVSLTVIMDCCHSGSNTRAVLPPDAPSIPRFLPNPLDIMESESGRKLRGKVQGSLRVSTAPKRKKSDVIDADIPELLVTGCRDTQTSADAHIGGSYNGALTYCLVETLKAAGGAISYRQLHAGTVKRLKQGGYDQVPQLEGRSAKFDRPFLAPEP